MSDLWERLRANPDLDERIREEIMTVFGKKGSSALAAIDAGRIKKYLDFFVVEGKTAAYIVEEDFCTCSDFMFRNRTCWHLLAVRIAAVTGRFRHVNGWYTDQMK